uniref:Large ribosomal subunit protein mL49 n=1 Tax=Psilocybe cubensis TaxID=181762 RepID=A0A8H8CNZ1_PSICU
MFSLARRQVASQLTRTSANRSFSEAAASTSNELASTSSTLPPSKPATLPYYVPRNTRGNLPVYTDVRNAGGRHLILIRNIEGNTGLLARDISESLFEKDTYEASRLKVQITQNKHLILSGGHWKNHVIEWLRSKGF